MKLMSPAIGLLLVIMGVLTDTTNLLGGTWWFESGSVLVVIGILLFVIGALKLLGVDFNGRANGGDAQVH